LQRKAGNLIRTEGVRSRLRRGLITYTFDDFPRSAWRTGGAIMQDHGLSATYFVSGDLCGRMFDGVEQFREIDLLSAHQAGHEIGSHLFFHSSVLPVPNLREAIGRNQQFISERLGDQLVTSFAYPYGDVSLAAKIVCRKHYACCRGVTSGINRGQVDLSDLKAVCVFGRTFHATDWESLFTTAVAEHGWIILVLHDIDEVPSEYGCTPLQLERLVGMAKQAGLDAAPMKSALAEMAVGTGS